MILLVEDNLNDEKLTIRAFKKNSFQHEIVVMRDGVEAIDFLFGRGKYAERDTSELPEIILLDLKLPKMDGLDVLRYIREHDLTKLVPVIMLTTSDEQRDVIRSYELHVNSYIRKPVDFKDFVETVKQIGMYWLVLNQAPNKE